MSIQIQHVQNWSLFRGYKWDFKPSCWKVACLNTSYLYILYEYWWCLTHQLKKHEKGFQVGSSVLHKSIFILKTANIVCSFLTSHQNSQTNLTRDQTRKEQAEKRVWAQMHGKSARQGNIRQNDTMDRTGTFSLWTYIYETETVLKPVNFNSLRGVEKVRSESNGLPNSIEGASLPAVSYSQRTGRQP